jgi:hypothetical protein
MKLVTKITENKCFDEKYKYPTEMALKFPV